MRTPLAFLAHRRGRMAAMLAVGASLAAPLSAHAATEAYLSVGNSDFTDNTASADYPGAIPISSWTWGMQNGSKYSASGFLAGNPSFNQLNLTKMVDRTSPAFLTAADQMKPLTDVHLDLVTSTATGAKPFMGFCLQKPVVTSDTYSYKDNQIPVETVTMTYSGIVQGFNDGDWIRSGWDILHRLPITSC
jgi:type VI secretion system secreted protein Hcp